MPGTVEPISVGALEGRMSIVLPARELDFNDPSCMVRATLITRAPGACAVRIDGPIQWGTSLVDQAIQEFMADGRTCDLELWCERDPFTEVAWSRLPVWWVFDMSNIFQKPIGPVALATALAEMPFVPPPTEVVIRRPHVTNMSAGILDEVGTRMDPDTGWILPGSDEVLSAAIREVARAATPWGIRGWP